MLLSVFLSLELEDNGEGRQEDCPSPNDTWELNEAGKKRGNDTQSLSCCYDSAIIGRREEVCSSSIDIWELEYENERGKVKVSVTQNLSRC